MKKKIYSVIAIICLIMINSNPIFVEARPVTPITVSYGVVLENADWDTTGNFNNDQSERREMGKDILGIVGLFVILLLAVVLFLSSNKSKNGHKKWAKNPTIKTVSKEEMKRYIRHFDERKFFENTSELFIQIQGSTLPSSLETIKSLISPELYGRFQGQLAYLESRHEQKIIRDFEIIDQDITGVTIQNNLLIIDIIFVIKQLEYVVNTNDQTIVSGRTDKKEIVTYQLSFAQPVPLETTPPYSIDNHHWILIQKQNMGQHFAR